MVLAEKALKPKYLECEYMHFQAKMRTEQLLTKREELNGALVYKD